MVTSPNSPADCRGGMQTSYLCSMHELLGGVIIHSENFQKWVGFTEEILKQIDKIKVSSILSFWMWSSSDHWGGLIITVYPLVSCGMEASCQCLLEARPQLYHPLFLASRQCRGPFLAVFLSFWCTIAYKELHLNSKFFVTCLLGWTLRESSQMESNGSSLRSQTSAVLNTLIRLLQSHIQTLWCLGHLCICLYYLLLSSASWYVC